MFWDWLGGVEQKLLSAFDWTRTDTRAPHPPLPFTLQLVFKGGELGNWANGFASYRILRFENVYPPPPLKEHGASPPSGEGGGAKKEKRKGNTLGISCFFFFVWLNWVLRYDSFHGLGLLGQKCRSILTVRTMLMVDLPYSSTAQHSSAQHSGLGR